MNTTTSRLAGVSSQLSQRLAPAGRLLKSVSTPPSRAIVVATGSALALAIVAAGAMLDQGDTPDPTETAAVTARPVVPDASAANRDAEPASAIIPAGAGDTVAAKQARQPAEPMRAGTLQPSTASHFEMKSPAGPDERGSQAKATAGITAPVQAPDVTPETAIPLGLRGSINVQIAESEAEIAMLEASTGMIGANAPGGQSAALDGPLPTLSPAKVAKYANLRDGPADEANVIVVVPANAEIEAEADCNWCTVVYKDQRGYIYKDLIRRDVKEEAAAGQGLF